jgi:hypothetical protein
MMPAHFDGKVFRTLDPRVRAVVPLQFRVLETGETLRLPS